MTKAKVELIHADLCQFSGTTNYYRHPILKRLVYTEGVDYLAKNGGAYWLIDAIASHQLTLGDDPSLREFQVWVLLVDKATHKAKLICQRGQSDESKDTVLTQEIEFTDFPLDKITLYLCLAEENYCVLMLPSEY